MSAPVPLKPVLVKGATKLTHPFEKNKFELIFLICFFKGIELCFK